ncbi:MAG: transglycosylase domain-containing protein, partial [Clostridia bacterium]
MDKKNLNSTGKNKELRTGGKNVETVDGRVQGKKSTKKNRKTGWKIFRICLFSFIAICIIALGIVIGVISNIVSKTDTVALEELTLNMTSLIFNKDGEQISSLFGEENRISIEYKDIPENLINAIISIEDERFLQHSGVDVKRTIGAIGTFILNGGKSNFGGSTITQQLVKNIKDDDETNWTRKIREWYRATLLEKKLTKEEIFESYVNTIYLGDGASGVEVASQNFFGKSVKDLTLGECAIIAAQIQTPEATNPYKSEESKKKLLDRQKIVLNKMKSLGKITQEQYDEVLKQEIAFKKNLSKGAKQTYFVDAVIEEVIKGLMEQKDVSYGVAQKMLFSNGYKIYTTQDSKVQKAIDDAYNNSKLFYTDKKGDFMQSSMVVMDQKNGNVLGLIGGAGEKTTDRGTNRAIGYGGGRRQLGSCMKPFGAYGPAFENGVLAPSSGLDDSPLTIGNWSPKNYYGYYKGYVTARSAVAYSMNIPAVKAYLKVDPDYAFNFAKNAGLPIVKADKGPSSLALGGLTNGVTTLEVANAYSTIANGGIHVVPKLFTKVLDNNDNEILIANSEAKRVMKETTAYMLTDCLQAVTQPGGTAYRSVSVKNIDVAGK